MPGKLKNLFKIYINLHTFHTNFGKVSVVSYGPSIWENIKITLQFTCTRNNICQIMIDDIFCRTRLFIHVLEIVAVRRYSLALLIN